MHSSSMPKVNFKGADIFWGLVGGDGGWEVGEEWSFTGSVRGRAHVFEVEKEVLICLNGGVENKELVVSLEQRGFGALCIE